MRLTTPRNFILATYLFFLLVLLPCDWFGPTAKILREAGAKPAILFLIAGSILIAVLSPRSLLKISAHNFLGALTLFGILGLGTIAFAINTVCAWSWAPGYVKNPTFEFVAQAALFTAFSLVVLIHAAFLREQRWRNLIVSLLPWAALIQLAVFVLEAFHILSPAGPFLSLFRTADNIGRPSGLMSEPSYFGAFAGLYGGPLIMTRSVSHYRWRCALGLTLFVCAILVRAKTFIPVLLCEFAVQVLRNPKAALRFRYIPIATAVILVSAYVVIANEALNLQGNLSTIMRIGSAQLGLNAALHGYGLSGIGFGQFTFFYRAKFAPSYLYLSAEAANQLSHQAAERASTFNLYVRLLLETGVFGLALFVGWIYGMIKSTKHISTPDVIVGVLLLAGSIGFLFTQDAYFYPPLALSLALLLGRIGDPSLNKRRNSSAPISMEA